MSFPSTALSTPARRTSVAALIVLALVAGLVSLVAVTGAQTTSTTQAAELTMPAGKKRAPRINPLVREATGPNYTDRVVLRYDDCPRSSLNYRTIIDTAVLEDIALLIAPTAECVAQYQVDEFFDLVAYARDRGMYVINHSTDHTDYLELPLREIRDQLRSLPSNWGATPKGRMSPLIRRAFVLEGMYAWRWSLASADTNRPPLRDLVKRVLTRTQPGDTVLQHMQTRNFTPVTFLRIVDGLRARDLELCALPRRRNGNVRPTTAVLPHRLPC